MHISTDTFAVQTTERGSVGAGVFVCGEAQGLGCGGGAGQGLRGEPGPPPLLGLSSFPHHAALAGRQRCQPSQPAGGAGWRRGCSDVQHLKDAGLELVTHVLCTQGAARHSGADVHTPSTTLRCRLAPQSPGACRASRAPPPPSSPRSRSSARRKPRARAQPPPAQPTPAQAGRQAGGAPPPTHWHPPAACWCWACRTPGCLRPRSPRPWTASSRSPACSSTPPAPACPQSRCWGPAGAGRVCVCVCV